MINEERNIISMLSIVEASIEAWRNGTHCESEKD